jgi:hypothetical protein
MSIRLKENKDKIEKTTISIHEKYNFDIEHAFDTKANIIDLELKVNSQLKLLKKENRTNEIITLQYWWENMVAYFQDYEIDNEHEEEQVNEEIRKIFKDNFTKIEEFDNSKWEDVK